MSLDELLRDVEAQPQAPAAPSAPLERLEEAGEEIGLDGRALVVHLEAVVDLGRREAVSPAVP